MDGSSSNAGGSVMAQTFPQRSEVQFTSEFGTEGDGSELPEGYCGRQYLAFMDSPEMQVYDLDSGDRVCTVADLTDDRQETAP